MRALCWRLCSMASCASRVTVLHMSLCYISLQHTEHHQLRGPVFGVQAPTHALSLTSCSDSRTLPLATPTYRSYIKSKGLQFGIYGAAGETTCAARAGGLYHERVDAQTCVSPSPLASKVACAAHTSLHLLVPRRMNLPQPSEATHTISLLNVAFLCIDASLPSHEVTTRTCSVYNCVLGHQVRRLGHNVPQI